ncbi:DUF6517 family protein [Natronorarus salvus]|uniref:DUF6517 family protein n=1 Tax=Natronorarus salvus TaxID=3117733 RepID=UPI002F26C85A
MLSRRAVLGGAAATVLAAASGVGVALGRSSLDTVSEPVGVREETLSLTDYRPRVIGQTRFTRELGAGSASHDIGTTNYLAEYDRRASLGSLTETRLGVFAVVSTPKAQLLGLPLNPIAWASERRLVELFQTRYDRVRDITPVASEEATVLDTVVSIDEFDAVGSVSDREVPLTMHATRVESRADVVLAIALYPRPLEDERPTAFSLFEGIEHG